VNNYNGHEKRWDSPATASMLASTNGRANFIETVVSYATAGGFAGIVLDFQELPPLSYVDYLILVAELSERLHAHSLQLLIAVPAADANYGYARFAKWADALIVMGHDEHFETTDPGPLAGQGWFEAVLRDHFSASTLVSSSSRSAATDMIGQILAPARKSPSKRLGSYWSSPAAHWISIKPP